MYMVVLRVVVKAGKGWQGLGILQDRENLLESDRTTICFWMRISEICLEYCIGKPVSF